MARHKRVDMARRNPVRYLLIGLGVVVAVAVAVFLIRSSPTSTDNAASTSVASTEPETTTEATPSTTLPASTTEVPTTEAATTTEPPVASTTPVVSVNTPPGDTDAIQPLLLTGSAQDDTGIDKVLVSVFDTETSMWWGEAGWQSDSTSVKAQVGSPGDPSTNWSYTFDPDEPSTEPYTIEVQAFDVDGEASDAVQRSVALVEGVSFTVAGDMGARSAGTATLNLINELEPNAHFAVGDLSYQDLTPEPAWCSYVQDIVGTDLPFEVISGNHEQDDREEGFIRNFAACLPDKLNVSGDYGVQFVADIGGTVGVIAIVPDLQIDGVEYTYVPGSPERRWLESAVTDIRARDMWVVILHHKTCINAAEKACNVGEELANWEAANADVVVMGHSHTYGRSHQLSCVEVGTVASDCISDDDGDHQQGNGAVFVINGTGGRSRPVDRSDSEAGYFAALLGSEGADGGNGVIRIDATGTTLTGTFVGSTTDYTDTFTIRR